MRLRLTANRSLCLAVCLLLCLYVATYIQLSRNGCYEPTVWGLDHVKCYGWAPAGFMHDYQWNKIPMLTFMPLYCLDTCVWHREDDLESGRYPVHWH